MNIVKITPYTYYVSNIPYLYEQIEYHGASTDNKPTLEAKNRGSKFICVDNGDEYNWSGSAWVLVNYGTTNYYLEYIVGNLPELDTENKDTVVAAINEVYEDAQAVHHNRVTVFESDFATATDMAIPGIVGSALSSGTIASVAGEVNHPGIIAISDSTTSNGGYKYLTSGDAFLLGGGEKTEFIFSLGAGASRTTASARLGFQDGATIDATVGDGIWLNIVGDGTKATISGNANDSTGVATTATTYTAEVDGTWYYASITLSADKLTATFDVKTCADGLSVWGNTLTTKLPTGAGKQTGWGIIAGQTTNDAAAVIIRMDYANMSIDRTLVR